MMERDARFAQESYWQSRYDTSDNTVVNIAHAADGASFYDWYIEYRIKPSSPLRNVMQDCAPATQFPRVIDLGCGDSALCRELWRDSYMAVGIDIAASAGHAQRTLVGGVPSFVHCRVAALPLRANSFDVAMDKGTLDALLCCGDERGARELLAQVCRIVRDGGWFFSVTYACPDQRIPLLLSGLPGCRRVRVHKLTLTTRNRFNGRRFHYLYTCRQGSGNSSSVLGNEARLAGRLVAACVTHDVSTTTTLLANGVSPLCTSGNLEGTTASMVAAGVGALGCLRVLADAAGANHMRTACDVLGNAALHHAAKAGQSATLDFLLRYCHPQGNLPTNEEGASVLQMAAASGDLGCVRLLLWREGDRASDGALGACAADHTGFTPLHAAAYRGHRAICEELLAAGADATAECGAPVEGFARQGSKEQWKCASPGQSNCASPAQSNCASPALMAETSGHQMLAKRLRQAAYEQVERERLRRKCSSIVGSSSDVCSLLKAGSE